MSKYPGRIVSNLAPAGYSVFFDGSNDRLIIANTSSAFPTGTQEFTLEFWAYKLNAWNTNDQFLFQDSATAGLQVWVNTAGGIFRVGSLGVAGIVDYAYSNLSINTWTHFAVSRKVNSWALWVNGTRVATATYSSGLSSAVGTQTIGGASGSASWNGYISNARIVRGATIYDPASTTINVPTQLFVVPSTTLLTCNSPAIVDQSTNAFAITVNDNAAVSTFTPFTAYVPYNPALGASTPGVWTVDEAMQAAATRQWNMYDPNFPNTTLLLHGNPTNGTSFITDASTNNFTVTPLATPRAANLSPFSLTTFATSGSGYFNGANSDAVEIANNAAFDFGTGDVTVEAWVNLASTSAIQNLIDCGPSSGSGFTSWTLDITASGFIRFNSYVGGTYQAIEATSNALATNQWYHIAFTRSSGTNRLFVNGAVCTTTGTLTQAINSGGNTVLIGRGKYSGFTRPTTGYFSNVRIVKGVGVYTGAFTTPTAPLTATQAAGTNISAITGTQTSLLTLQNSQSANNNAFLDSSSNNFLITRNGNTTQGSFSPFSQTGWSVFFDGDGDRLVSSAAGLSTSLAFGTGDLTVSLWYYPFSFATAQMMIDLRSVNGGSGIYMYNNGSGNVIALDWNVERTTSNAMVANQWNYVVYTRQSGVLRVFINGVLGYSGASTASMNNSKITIGGHVENGFWANGYISNVRILNGTGYSSVTVPVLPDTAITNTVFLTCQSNRFVDNSTNNYAITTTGTPSVQAFSPFYPTVAYTPQTIGGSAYLDGSSDSLVSASLGTSIGTGDYCLEALVYTTSASTTFVSSVVLNNSSGYIIYLQISGNTVRFLDFQNPGTNFIISGGTINSNEWVHIVGTRQSGNMRAFVNGRLAAYQASVNFNYGTAGTVEVPPSVAQYVSGVRVNIGSVPTSYQTSSTTTGTQIFTPPTAPTTTTSQGATAGNVRLLLNMTNAGVVDSTGKNALETVGNAQISTAVSRFGGSSMFFDGTGDALSISAATPPIATLGDFTAEAWIYVTTSGDNTVFYLNGNTAAFAGCRCGVISNQIYLLVSTTGGSWAINTGPISSVPSNIWHHIAVVRSGGTFYLFLNGTSILTSTAISAATALMSGSINLIGAINNSGISAVTNGYIDDLRITRFARYTGNFTPQTSQWQDQ